MVEGSIRRWRSWGRGWALGASLALLPLGGGGATAPGMVLHYVVEAGGLPVLSVEFRLEESGLRYRALGKVRTAGLLRLMSSYSLVTESHGAMAGGEALPEAHEMASGTRGRAEKQQHLSYPGDGRVLAAVDPPEPPDKPKPGPDQILNTVDPLTALLRASHAIAQSGRCDMYAPVFDGRRRYDVILTDEGAEKLDNSVAYKGPMHRCQADVVKLAGFSFDRDYVPRTNHGRVWIASPRPGLLPLVIRLDFSSDWGQVKMYLEKIETGS